MEGTTAERRCGSCRVSKIEPEATAASLSGFHVLSGRFVQTYRLYSETGQLVGREKLGGAPVGGVERLSAGNDEYSLCGADKVLSLNGPNAVLAKGDGEF